MSDNILKLTVNLAQLLALEFEALKNQGVTIILITHKLREIMSITDHVSVMRAGKMVAHRETNGRPATGVRTGLGPGSLGLSFLGVLNVGELACIATGALTLLECETYALFLGASSGS